MRDPRVSRLSKKSVFDIFGKKKYIACAPGKGLLKISCRKPLSERVLLFQ
jgi:hypothetical protein